MTNDTIVGIHHIQLAMPVGSEEAARRFYSGVVEPVSNRRDILEMLDNHEKHGGRIAPT